MFFSIIIPTLNEEQYVGNILEDLVNQDFQDYEVIHVDGRSEDKTCDAVRQYTKRLAVKTVISNRRNLSYQRNTGANIARGSYLIFIDADTRIPQKTFLSKLKQEIETSKFLFYFPLVTITQKDPGLRVTFAFYNKAIEMSQLFPTPLPTQGIAIMERYFFYHLGAYHISKKHDKKVLFAEDQELLKRARKCGVMGKVAHEIHYVMSLRRYEREGWLGVVPKLLLSTIEQSLGRSYIKNHYEMGGHLYKEQKTSGS